MRPVLLAGLALALGSGCAVPRPYGEGIGLHTHLSGGYRAHDAGDFEGHAAYGLDLVTRDPASGWGYELGGSYGAEDDGGPRDHKAEFDEFSLGLRRSWQTGGVAGRPYLALGGAYVLIEHRLHAPRFEFEEQGAAAYVRGGSMWSFGTYPIDRGTEVLAGVDVRAQAGDDMDYVQIALVLAFGR